MDTNQKGGAGSGSAAMPGLASFSIFGGRIESGALRRFIQRGFHRNEPLLLEIVQRINEILRNICRFAYALHKPFALRFRQRFDLLEDLLCGHLNLRGSRINHLS